MPERPTDGMLPEVRINSRALARFDSVSWQRIADRVAEWTAPHSPFMTDVVASIRSSGADRLAGFMSMHDLAVTTTPDDAGR